MAKTSVADYVLLRLVGLIITGVRLSVRSGSLMFFAIVHYVGEPYSFGRSSYFGCGLLRLVECMYLFLKFYTFEGK